ncbi:MAG: CoA transferase [Chloroflexi bacterium]|nr:CoA transferase [Chloroflexota bacterium]
MDGTPIKAALAGVRVVDFTWAASGPLCTLYLALLGAEVIKIESRRSLDLARRGYYTLVDDIDASPNFNDMNLNKLTVPLDMGTDKGRELARGLVAISDVAIQNFRPGVIDRWGLGYEELRKIRPDIVMLSSSTSGQTGPERDLPGYATTFGAYGGLGYVTGHEGGPATEIWDSVDMRLGTSIALAVLMALYHRRKTGQGQHIDLSSREVISSNIGDVFLEYFMTGRVSGPQGNRDEIMAPHNCYPCRGDDRWISIAVATDDEWRALCRVARRPEWAEDPRFADQYTRWRHQDELDELLARWTRRHTAEALTRRLQRAGVAAMPSMDARDVYDDAHSKSRGIFWDVPHPKLGMTHPVRPPWLLSETPARPVRYGPMFGQDLEPVVSDLLGISQRDREAMAADGVFQ